jgi:hypothetical protein
MTFKEKFITLQFAHPMTEKSLNLVKNEENILKCLMIYTSSMIGGSTLYGSYLFTIAFK